MVGVREVTHGVFRVNGELCVWDDYEDDREHDGYGELVGYYDGSRREILKIYRDEDEKIIGFDLG